MTNGLLNPTHLMLLLIVVLIVLGPKRLPGAGRSLGRGMREFKDAITGRDDPAQPTQPEPAPVIAPPAENTVPSTADQASVAEPPSTPVSAD